MAQTGPRHCLLVANSIGCGFHLVDSFLNIESEAPVDSVWPAPAARGLRGYWDTIEQSA
jgi:hypothetical protein